MPKFLSQRELYRLLQRELPPYAYPDGPASAFYSTADMASVAACMASAYHNLERIYDNYWPQTAVERITDWEITAFGAPQLASQSIAEKQDRVTQKIRLRKGLTIQDMIDTVKAVIGTDKQVEVIEWGCSSGGWMLDVSLLGVSTILNGANLLRYTGPNICEQNPADYGISPAEYTQMQIDAYTFEVLVFTYVLTAQEVIDVTNALLIADPARSAFVITSGVDPNLALEI